MASTSLDSPWATERASKAEIETRKREAVLKAAAIAFVEHGYYGATMDKIAELLHISKPTLYKYYKNKSELLSACQDKSSARFTTLAREAREMDGTALEKIKHYQYRSVEYMTDEFGRALALVDEGGGNSSGRKQWRDRRDKITDIFRDIVRDGIEDGEINPNVDPKLVMLALFGAFNEIAVWFNPDGPYTAKEVCDQYFEMFDNGLKA